jgi:hypothetical protein
VNNLAIAPCITDAGHASRASRVERAVGLERTLNQYMGYKPQARLGATLPRRCLHTSYPDTVVWPLWRYTEPQQRVRIFWPYGIHKVKMHLATGELVFYYYAWRGGPRLKGGAKISGIH